MAKKHTFTSAAPARAQPMCIMLHSIQLVLNPACNHVGKVAGEIRAEHCRSLFRLFEWDSDCQQCERMASQKVIHMNHQALLSNCRRCCTDRWEML